MKLENVFDIHDFTEPELERLRHEIIVIKHAQCENTIIKAIEEIKSISPEKEFYVYGAANCSFLLYAFGITKVDSIEFDLPFERFINPLWENTTPIIQPEFIPRAHKKAKKLGDVLTEDLNLTPFINGNVINSLIPVSKYNNQPILDIINTDYDSKLRWQEQFINILNRVGGIPLDLADLMRREVCKYGTTYNEFNSLSQQFAQHAVRLGYNEEDSVDFFKSLAQNIRYFWNKAHFIAVKIHEYDFEL